MQNDKETLSAAMDGDPGHANAQTLARIAASNDTRATWARYHLIGDVLRSGLTEVTPSDFSERVREGISSEPAILAPPRQRAFIRPAAGLAIAASVAALAVVGVKQMDQQVPEVATEAVIASAVPQADIARSVAVEAEMEPLLVEDEILPSQLRARGRLNSYLVKFNEQRSSLAVPGVNPYVRIVGFESE